MDENKVILEVIIDEINNKRIEEYKAIAGTELLQCVGCSEDAWRDSMELIQQLPREELIAIVKAYHELFPGREGPPWVDYANSLAMGHDPFAPSDDDDAQQSADDYLKYVYDEIDSFEPKSERSYFEEPQERFVPDVGQRENITEMLSAYAIVIARNYHKRVYAMTSLFLGLIDTEQDYEDLVAVLKVVVKEAIARELRTPRPHKAV